MNVVLVMCAVLLWTYLFGIFSALICMTSAFMWHELYVLARRESSNVISCLFCFIFIHTWGIQVQGEVFSGQTIARTKQKPLLDILLIYLAFSELLNPMF